MACLLILEGPIKLFGHRLFFLLSFCTCYSVSAQIPERIVSTNLCTDQMLLLLAKPETILSVSFLSFDPEESPFYSLAKNYHPNHGKAEEILTLNPDLILVGQYTDNNTQHLLRRLGFNVLEINEPLTFDAFISQYLDLGVILNRQEVAERIGKLLRSRLDGMVGGGQKKLGNIAVFYSNGALLRPRSLAADVLTKLGFTVIRNNIFSVEEILRSGADYIVRMVYRADSPVRGAGVLDHPILLRYLDSKTITHVPQSWFTCSSPYLLDAMENILAVAAKRL